MTDTTVTETVDSDAVVTLRARMPHPAFVLEGGADALAGVGRVVATADLPDSLLQLVSLRASQINGCSWCTVDHARQLAAQGASVEKVNAVAAWRDAPYFSERERVTLEFTEVLTRLADHHDPVSDELWDEITGLFDHREISALVFQIGAINVWNRINAAIRQPAGRV